MNRPWTYLGEELAKMNKFQVEKVTSVNTDLEVNLSSTCFFRSILQYPFLLFFSALGRFMRLNVWRGDENFVFSHQEI